MKHCVGKTHSDVVPGRDWIAARQHDGRMGSSREARVHRRSIPGKESRVAARGTAKQKQQVGRQGNLPIKIPWN